MRGNGYDYRVSLPRLSGTSKNLPRAVLAALAAADSSPGRNIQPRDVQCFELGAYLLYVVPFVAGPIGGGMVANAWAGGEPMS
jgi:hypothetical protein